ncbi:hypothetical protein DPEC_G00349160 [Dallia pectoralis]|uniref:Uncharacterized protein n=1 Tax=Dallia pectoralis TaxID=75939 RepID=A0ACC2F1B8_DALPE|nr:hypothetical protein DPEC_G00349160 [Dallia pectoralis]
MHSVCRVLWPGTSMGASECPVTKNRVKLKDPANPLRFLARVSQTALSTEPHLTPEGLQIPISDSGPFNLLSSTAVRRAGHSFRR